MTGSTLRDELLLFKRAYLIHETSVSIAAIHISRLGIQYIPPVLRAFHQRLVILRLSQGLRHLGHAEIIVGIFQGAAHLLIGMESILHLILQWNITIFQITLQGPTAHTILVFCL